MQDRYGTLLLCDKPFFRFDVESGKHYFIDESKGEQSPSDCHGNIIRSFDPNLTGKYNYDQRT